MSPLFFSIIAGILLTLLILKRFVFKNASHRNLLFLNALMLGTCLFLIGYHFFIRGQKTGLIAVGLGGIAAGKYLYDQRENNDTGN
jgi:hypothetical protein